MTDDTPHTCIATLGPGGTFSELAAIKYSALTGTMPEISLFPTIKKVFGAIGDKCQFGIVPMENMTEGYVQPTLDLLLKTGLKIISELILPVQFSFVSYASSLDIVKTIYVQFVAQGQCQDFLDKMADAQIVTTSSNTEALPLLRREDATAGTVVPSHCIKRESAYPVVINDIADFKNNETRFVVLGTEERPYEEGERYKTSIAVVHLPDRPGMLASVLSTLAGHGLNLTSIMSRPTKERLGTYLFYIDMDGHRREEAVETALRRIQSTCTITVFGSYRRLGQPPPVPG